MASKTVTTKSGHRLTEADFERMADEAERGYDPSTFRYSRGRPPLESGTTESPRIAVRVPRSLRDRVVSRAAGEGRSLSQVVRQLLESYVGKA